MDDIDLAGLRNARWIRGAELPNGRTLRPYAMLRCGEFDQVDRAGIRAVASMAPALVLDLRSEREISAPHPLQDLAGYRWRPFIDASRDGERDPARERNRTDLYLGSLDRNGRTVAAAVREILSAPPGPVIAHCKSGVDRTGMLAALLLAAMGVPRSFIVADYLVAATLSGAPAGRASQVMAQPLSASTMVRVLEHLDTEYGGAEGYLIGHGVPTDAVATLTKRFTV